MPELAFTSLSVSPAAGSSHSAIPASGIQPVATLDTVGDSFAQLLQGAVKQPEEVLSKNPETEQNDLTADDCSLEPGKESCPKTFSLIGGECGLEQAASSSLKDSFKEVLTEKQISAEQQVEENNQREFIKRQPVIVVDRNEQTLLPEKSNRQEGEDTHATKNSLTENFLEKSQGENDLSKVVSSLPELQAEKQEKTHLLSPQKNDTQQDHDLCEKKDEKIPVANDLLSKEKFDASEIVSSTGKQIAEEKNTDTPLSSPLQEEENGKQREKSNTFAPSSQEKQNNNGTDISYTEKAPPLTETRTGHEATKTVFVDSEPLSSQYGVSSPQLQNAKENSTVVFLQEKTHRLSLSIEQHGVINRENTAGINKQNSDPIRHKLQSIIDAGDEKGIVSVSIKQTEEKQTTTILENIPRPPQETLIARENNTSLQEMSKPNEHIFKILSKETYAKDYRVAEPQRNITGQLQTEKEPTSEELTANNIKSNQLTEQSRERKTSLERFPTTSLPAEEVSSKNSSTDSSATDKDTTEQESQRNRKIPEELTKEKQVETRPNNPFNKFSSVEKTTEGSLFSSNLTNNSSLFSGQTGQQEIVETVSTPAQTITLPSGTVVRENEIVRQFMDKFQINGRNLESRINIKLNPAELGEIKIDLTVKEKSIKANVVAQSHITQGILEKNLGKLKSMLEEQGFSIDEFNVTSKEQSTAESRFFEQEFTQRQKEAFPNNSSAKRFHHQDDVEQEAEQNDSQVNVMA